MAEEELVLTVRLDDQASAKIAGLQEQLKQMGTGAQAAGAERNRRQTRESSEGAAQLSREMRGLAVTAGIVGGVVGAVATKVTDLGLSFLARVTDLKGYSAEMLKLQQASYTAGTSTAQFQANIDAFARSGIDAATAGRNIQGLSETLADLSRVNSQTRRELMRGLRPGEVSVMRQFVDDIVNVDPAEAFNKIKDFGEEIRDYQTKLYGPEAGARAEQRFYQAMGVPDAGRFRGRLAPVTEEQKKLFKDREEESNKFYTSSVKIETAWNRAAQSIVAVGMHLLPISGGMESMATYSDQIVGSLQKWEAEFRKTDGSFESLIRVTQEWGRGIGGWVGSEITKLATDVKTLVEELSKLPKLISDAKRFLEARPEDVVKRINEKQGPEAKTGYEWIQDYMAGKVDFLGNPIPLGEQSKALGAFEAGEQGRAGRPTTPPTTPPPTSVPPPPQAVIPAIPSPIVPPRVPALRPPEPPPTTPIEPKPETTTPPAPPPSVLKETSPNAALNLPAIPPPIIPPRMPPAAIVVPPTLVQPAPQPSPVIVQPAPQPSPVIVQPAPPPPVQVSPPAQPPVQPAAAQPPSSVMMKPAPSLIELLKQEKPEGAAGTPIILPKPMSPVVVPQPVEAAPIIVPPREPVAFNPDQPMPSAFDSGGRTIDLAGTGNPNQAASEKGQTQNWMDTAAGAGAALDRAAQRDVNVNGTGKISVDVRAPNGTNVRAQGEGLFRKTEISRQVQMEPASSGPVYPAGSVAEG